MPPERVPAGPAIGPLRRATRIEPPTSAAAAASVPRRPLRPRLALPELLYLSRNIVVIDVRGPLRMCISEYAPGYEAQHGISFEMATKWRQAAGGGVWVWVWGLGSQVSGASSLQVLGFSYIQQGPH